MKNYLNLSLKDLLKGDEWGAKLLDNPNDLTLKLLDQILQFKIPFNAPHGFQIKALKDNFVKVFLPYKRKNLNHVKSVHACAIATLGEFCAGLTLIKTFSFGQYRLILSKLEIEYFYQGKTGLTGEATLGGGEKERIKNELRESDLSLVTLTTQIFDESHQSVATVKSTWQLKNWKKVKTKV